jgi:hypothetical protein
LKQTGDVQNRGIVTTTIIIITRIAIVALPLIAAGCATRSEPAGQGVEDLGRAVEEHLPGLGANPTTDPALTDDPYFR